MKNIYIILIALLFGSGAMAQTAQPCSSCLPEGIEFTNRAMIDNFPTDYPDCTEIEGDVTILGGYNYPYITNLNGLNVLTSIRGNLNIIFNPHLTSLTGLDNLTSIGGDLIINENNSLYSLMGFENLVSIGGDLIISNILNTNGLKNLDKLENLESVGGNIKISTLSALTSLKGLDNLTSIKGNLDITGNAALASLTGLENVYSIGGNLFIYRNNALTSLAELENLNSIGGYLNIEFNEGLTSLTGLENLNSIGDGLVIYRNHALTSLTELENLNSIGGDLVIDWNIALTSLTGLENINAGTITALQIYENSSLSDCVARSICDYLAAPNGTIKIHDNATDCNSQEEVEDACILSVSELNTQSSLSFFPNPAANTITIEYPSPQNNTYLTIFNLNGQQLIHQAVTEQQTAVDISRLSSGAYFVKLISEEGVMVGKFLKK